MWRKWLAILGLVLFVAGLISFAAEYSLQQQALPEGVPLLTLMNRRAVLIAGVGILLGPLLTLPWWIQRLRQEEKWWQKRDEPVEGPPRVPN